MATRVCTVLLFIFLHYCNIIRGQQGTDSSDKVGWDSSTVYSFEGGEYGDTVYAFIYGTVYEPISPLNDTVKPLSSVIITIEQNHKTFTTDESGKFKIGFPRGFYSLIVSKPNYEPIRITNFYSDPDEFTTTEIILVKGKITRKFKVPKHKY